MAPNPKYIRDQMKLTTSPAGVLGIRLHDARHSFLSLLENAGVPISIVSAWAGHYDAAFTLRTYVHAGTADLAAAGDALARICTIE